ncbi:MAG: hypothetical protein H0V29_01765 [Thermoleophilaceae bacterium]|nr:hypothetical protein [Thermoleophilaceae bacterium]
MTPEAAFAAVLVALLVAAILARPILRGGEVDVREDEELASLETAKESKYREIRDAELDHRIGKLTEEDWRRTDRELRAQAVEILERMDKLGGDRAAEGR